MRDVTGSNYPDTDLNRLYPGMSDIEKQNRLQGATHGFSRIYGRAPARLFSAPGRTELGGNHTDHQGGLVIAAAVALDNIAAVLPNDENIIRVYSDSHGAFSIDLNDLSPKPEEAGTPSSLVRGIADFYSVQGYGTAGGFDAYVSSQVPVGSGLSSSAAFEVLVAAVMNGLSFGGTLPPELLARAGQYAENIHFGKPCGLMDQMASAVGGIIGIDFQAPDTPKAERLSVDFSTFGFSLCFIHTGSTHEFLGDEYSAIPAEMNAVAGLFGQNRLRDVNREEFYAALPSLKGRVTDRALLRAMHFYDENERVRQELSALRRGDMQGFLQLVQESGDSSWKLLQNIVPGGAVADQSTALALAWSRHLLGSSGACRIHGGGFGGTIQAYVPIESAELFRQDIESMTGAGSFRFLRLRDAGAAEIENRNGD